jgi:hypothetical protein
MKAKFSISDLLKDSKLAVSRFVIPILLSIIGAGIAIYSFNGKELSDTIISLLITVGLGISLFVALAIFFENRIFSIWIKIGGHLIAAVVLVCIFFQLREMQLFGLENAPLLIVRYAIIFHLLVSFLPFLGNQQNIGFWHYNRILFTRILLTAIFIATVYLGLAAALGAISQLFGITIESDVFFDLWAICFGPVSVIFFCAGVPKELKELETADEYSNILRIFVQFVLIPLVLIYLVIMYAYFGKIVIEANLPKGFLTYFIHAMLVLGLYAYLLIYPFQFVSNSKLIRLFTKFFFFVLIPVIAMQLVGIITRINQYGFTEERYLVLATALCVVSMIVYFVFLRKKNLIFIPVVIFVFTLISAIGPFSAKNVTIWSRKNRIEMIVTQLKMFDGKTMKPFKELSDKDTINIRKSEDLYDEIYYMVDEYDVTGLEPYLKIKSRQQINNEQLLDSQKAVVRSERISSYEIKSIQKEEFYKIMGQLNLKSSLEGDMADTVTAMAAEETREILFRLDCKLPVAISEMTDIQKDGFSSTYSSSTSKENKEFVIIKKGRKYRFDMGSLLNLQSTYAEISKTMKDLEPKSHAVLVMKKLNYTVNRKEILEIEAILCE